MSSRKQPDPNQESLLVSAATGQFAVREFADGEGAYVDRIEQKLHLMNTLGHLASASMSDGLVRLGEAGIMHRYGRNSQRVVEGAKDNRGRAINDAKRSFAHATGHYALIESGLMTAEEAARQTRSMFSAFATRYYGHRHYQDAQEYLKQLSSDVEDLQLNVSRLNREQGLRPHAPVTGKASVSSPVPESAADAAKAPAKRYDLLDSRERMRAIRYDPRAAFLPATNREKTLVMTLLDYLDNPDYPLGVSNQFLEVLLHQQKLGMPFRDVVKAAESRAWEVGDYAFDASRSFCALVDLETALEGVSPRVSLAEATENEADREGAVALLRYRNVRQFVETGDTGSLRDPLRTQEDRWVPRGKGRGPGKHKTIHSQYTSPRQTTDFAAFLQKGLEAMTVAQARKLLPEAIENEVQRARFMTDCLRKLGSSNTWRTYRAMEPFYEAVQQSLEALEREPVMEERNDKVESVA